MFISDVIEELMNINEAVKVHCILMKYIKFHNVSEMVQDNLKRFSASTTLQRCLLRFNRIKNLHNWSWRKHLVFSHLGQIKWHQSNGWFCCKLSYFKTAWYLLYHIARPCEEQLYFLSWPFLLLFRTNVCFRLLVFLFSYILVYYIILFMFKVQSMAYTHFHSVSFHKKQSFVYLINY